MHFLKSQFTLHIFAAIFLLTEISTLEHSVDESNEWTLHRSHTPQQQTQKHHRHHPAPKPSTIFDKSTCHFEGINYPAGARMVAHDDPCIHCFCRGSRGRTDCYRQNCPPPPADCAALAKPGLDSCPHSAYNCTIPERLQSSVIRLREGSSNHFSNRRQQLFGQRRRSLPFVVADCLIRGIAYKVGETVGVASSNCLHCYCARQSLLCVPLCCYEPLGTNSRESKDEQQQPQMVQYHRAVHRREPHPLEYL